MSEAGKQIFGFEIGQLVRLSDREGQIISRHDYGHREPEYRVQYFLKKVYDRGGGLLANVESISESELAKLQPPPMIPVAEAQKIVGEALALAQAAEGRLHRHLLAARRKARKSASRKRR